MFFIFVIACCFYVLATVTTIPIWYLMLTKRFLHANFRTLIILTTLGGQCVCILTQILTAFRLFHLRVEDIYTFGLPIVRYGGMLFHVGNFLLCVERAIAVFVVSHYEKYVSPIITIMIILTAGFISIIAGTILNALIKNHGSTPTLVFMIAYATVCSLISLSLVLRRRFLNRNVQSCSLQQKFQDKENGRTGPVYTSIAINELLSSIIISVIYACIGAARKYNIHSRISALSDSLDLVDSYRYLFINVTILVNSFLWIRSQKKVFIDHASGDQYFQQLENAWN